MRPTAALGSGFAGLFAAIKKVRPHRPIHPDGVMLHGTLTRTGPVIPSGISWIDAPGEDKVRARLSRSVGLPRWSPDILGLAVRVPSGANHFDVLLASTGVSFPGRFVLVPQQNIMAATFTSLMPYKGDKSAVLLGAFPLDPGGNLPATPVGLRTGLAKRPLELALCFSRPLGSWIRFGTLRLLHDPEQSSLRFDPIRHPLPGSETYAWTRALREPSYAEARADPDTQQPPVAGDSASGPGPDAVPTAGAPGAPSQ
ncbi:hypothetical protein [Arthrobacter sp. CAN_C5]|uniref:hypothetical protein n=1 Tax=Arthrobacter sp. CAN_C5 TaxID=2760706 RepID=UPI001AE72FA9|nr:hypothetical protein [Arthrobacter sp. CAN_C5]MBP2216818.1 hypothetical protein [Arthrobacter sp. CAN_C5]